MYNMSLDLLLNIYATKGPGIRYIARRQLLKDVLFEISSFIAYKLYLLRIRSDKWRIVIV